MESQYNQWTCTDTSSICNAKRGTIAVVIVPASETFEIFLSNAFFNFSSFTYTISQVVQLSTANFTMTDNFYFNNVWGMKRPCFLNAYTIG